jgi:hypothetical protein
MNTTSQSTNLKAISPHHQTAATTREKSANKFYCIPMDLLKRPIGCNLLCFIKNRKTKLCKVKKRKDE